MASGGTELDILEDLAFLAHRPLDFVYWAFPWGEESTELETRAGPEAWQWKLLWYMQNRLLAGDAEGQVLEEAIQIAVRSGHDIGKTAFLAWVVWWAMATAEDTRGRATANTEKQLRTILWPEIAKWHRLFIARDFFKVTATSVHSSDPTREKTWRIDAVPWSEDNPEAFAGLHNYGKRVLVLFDEASGIHDKIWEVVDGVMHEGDTELIWLCTGNPTKNHGRFYECWNRFRDTWSTLKVDSREVTFTNKGKIERSIEQWGVNSDYVKVRYLGEFPDAASTQLIPIETIRLARVRPVQSLHFEPLIMSLDVARFGSNESVLGFRRGKDARTIPVERWRGLSTMETADRCASRAVQYEPDAIFIDEGGVGGGVVDRMRQLGHHVIGVDFGGKPGSQPNGIRVYNKRAEMYVALREWLREGGCVEDNEDLQAQLVSVEYFFIQGKPEIRLIPKEDMEGEGFESPDWGDQLAMTFAFPVSPRMRGGMRSMTSDYDPLAHSALPAANDTGSMYKAVGNSYEGW